MASWPDPFPTSASSSTAPMRDAAQTSPQWAPSWGGSCTQTTVTRASSSECGTYAHDSKASPVSNAGKGTKREIAYSTSSALPDGTPPDKTPKLAAHVHEKVDAGLLRNLHPEHLRFRAFHESDLEELKLLHREWFPLNYDESFYTNSVNQSGRLLTCAAVHPDIDSCIIGLATVSANCHYHKADISRVLSMHCDIACTAGPRVAYLLTLGVIDEFRRRGLAKKLIRETILLVEKAHPEVQALTLHVVSYNQAAISLYKSLGFIEVGYYPGYYELHGTQYGSYLLAKYFTTPPFAICVRRASANFVWWGKSRISSLYDWFFGTNASGSGEGEP